MDSLYERYPAKRSNCCKYGINCSCQTIFQYIGRRRALHRCITLAMICCQLCLAPVVFAASLGSRADKAPESQASKSAVHAVQENHDQKDLGLLALSFEELMQIEVTSSTLTKKTLRTVPSSVTVFTRKEISQIGVDSLEELMNFVPGFQSARQGESSLLRGFSSRGRKIGSAGREILVMIDGLRIDNAWSGGMSSAAPLISLTNVERVEFIRGPGSAIYGSNAMLGVVNIFTVRDVNELGLAYGHNNIRAGHALAAGEYADFKLDAFARGFADDGRDYQVADTFSANRITTSDPQHGLDLQARCRWHQMEVKFMQIKRSSEDFYLLDTLSNGFNNTQIRYNNIAIEQGIAWKPAFESKILINYKWSHIAQGVQLLKAGALAAISAPPSADPLFVKSDIADKELRVQMHNDWNMGNNNSLQFGLEYRRPEWEEIKGENNFDFAALSNGSFPVPFYGDFSHYTTAAQPGNMDIWGIYGQYNSAVWKSTVLTLGARYDNYSGIGSRVSPRLGLVYQLTDAQTVKMLYGEAFRAPSVAEMRTINNPIIIGNPNLDPETVKTWELIWMSNWGAIMPAVSYFHNTFKDSIIQDSVGTKRLYVNSGTEKNQGIEAELAAQLGEHWYLRTTFTYIFDKPASTFRESEIMASVILNCHLKAWNFNLAANYQGQKQMAVGSAANLVTLDSFWVLNAKVKYELANHWTIFLQTKNLLDEAYRTPPQGASLQEGIPNRGVEVSGGLIWQF